MNGSNGWHFKWYKGQHFKWLYPPKLANDWFFWIDLHFQGPTVGKKKGPHLRAVGGFKMGIGLCKNIGVKFQPSWKTWIKFEIKHRSENQKCLKPPPLKKKNILGFTFIYTYNWTGNHIAMYMPHSDRVILQQVYWHPWTKRCDIVLVVSVKKNHHIYHISIYTMGTHNLHF